MKTRSRIPIACLLVVASLFGGIVGEALLLTFGFLKNHGSLPPLSSVRSSAVLVEGLALFVPAIPALLIVLVYHVLRCVAPLRGALFQFSWSLLFMITSAMSWSVLRAERASLVGSALVALAIAVSLVIAGTRRSQNNQVEDIAASAANPHP